jgi:hypothetical protein
VINGLDGFVKGGKRFKMTPGVVAPLSLKWVATLQNAASVAIKSCLSLRTIVDELDTGKDTGWKIVIGEKKESLLALCTAHMD